MLILASIGDALSANVWHLRLLGQSATVWDALTLAMIAVLVWLGQALWRRRARRPIPVALALALSGLALGVLVWGTWVEPSRLEVVREHADLPDWPADEPLTIALVSDLHHGPNSSRGQLARLVAAINAAAPDVVLIAGDLTAYPGVPDLEALGQLAALQPRLGTFAVLGNHDYYGTEDQLRELQAVLAGAGVRVLQNEVERLIPGVALVGIDSARAGRADVDTTFGRLLPGRFVIGLAHEPETFAPLAERQVPLVLAGHTHGGQICLPGVGAVVPVSALHPSGDSLPLPRDKQAGWFKSGDSHLYITRGIGTTGPRARLFCRPELTLLTVARPTVEAL